MPGGINIENIFIKPHYKSILNLLIEFQDKEFYGKTGLRPIQFRYALEKGYRNSEDIRVQRSKVELRRFFGNKLSYLESNDRIISGCITSKNNLSKFLRNLQHPLINAIERKGSRPDIRYRIKTEFYNEGIRIRNRKAINIFSNDMIMDFSKEMRTRVKHIIYGLPPDILDYQKKMSIKESLQKIEKELEKIEDIIIYEVGDIIQKSISRFSQRTKSPTLKKFLKQHKIKVWALAQDALSADEDCSKSAFYEALGWIFEVPGVRATTFSGANVIINVGLGDGLLEFIKGKRRKLTKNEVKKYTKAWSENSFGMDYGFSLSDIQEMLEWGWNNREFFYKYYPLSIAYSRYREYEDLTQFY